MINVGIVGGTGYTGVELLRLLVSHPGVTIKVITSRSEAGRPVSELFPSLRGVLDLSYSEPDDDAYAGCDLVFFATPHGVAQGSAATILDRGIRIIDLSADFRIRDIALWEQWYGQAHGCPDLVSQAVYGLPEFNRDKIKGATLIACPGCYPTSVQLGFLPLLEAGIIDTDDLIANSASGASGAGKQAKVDNLLTEIADSFKAYGVA
ncbi:MAG: N-acetyl-gamma-glutamyl-phosphate reductase, partial [bacterium]